MKKEKRTPDRIRDSADAIRILEFLQSIGSIITIVLSGGNVVLIIIGIVGLLFVFLMHAFYCTLYGFSNLVEDIEEIKEIMINSNIENDRINDSFDDTTDSI